MKIINFVYVLLFLLLSSRSALAGQEIDIVTYADFSHIRDIAVSMDNVYFASSDGILIYDKHDESWEHPLTSSPGIDYQNIFRIYIDQFDRKLYARTEINSYEYDIMMQNWFLVNNIPVLDNPSKETDPSHIMFVPQQYIYIGNGFIQDQIGRQYPINRMIDDGSGETWLSIWGIGAAKSSSSSIIEFLPYGLIQNRVNTILNSDGVIVVSGDNIGSNRTGISLFDFDKNQFQYKESGISFDFPADDINCIEEDDKFYYVATEGGLIILDKKTLVVKKKITERHGLIDDELLSLKKVNDKLFIGSLNGLQVLSTSNDSLKLVYSSHFQNQEIYDFEFVDSTLWIASSIGAYQLHLGTNELKQFVDPHQIGSGRIYNIEHEGNKLYIASQTGMVRLDLKTGKTTPYISDSHGVNFRALAVNDDVAFISTDFGFTMFFLSEDGYSTEREFTTSDGIPSQFVYDLEVDGDYLWIGTDRGLSLFLWNDPNRID